MSVTYTSSGLGPNGGKSYKVNNNGTTIGTVYRADKTGWTALVSGRKIPLKESFTTRQRASEALLNVAAEKSRARAERRTSQPAKKAKVGVTISTPSATNTVAAPTPSTPSADHVQVYDWRATQKPSLGARLKAMFTRS